MAEQNTLPGLLKQIKALEKDVYELKRRQLPAFDGDAAELWNVLSDTLRPTDTPENLLLSANLLVLLSSALAVEINAVSTVNIQGPSGVNITSASFTDIILAGQVRINNYVQLDEVAGIGAAAANSGRIYMQDNGGGKTQFVARFPTGAVQVIATEP